MALFKSIGIVFRAVKYSETSLILDIFTREKGMRSFIVSGVRSSKSKNKASLYQHLNIIDLVAYDKDDKLARIKECKMEHYYQKVPFEVVRSSIGLFILEVCKNAIVEKEENRELFDFIYSRLRHLDGNAAENLTLLPLKFLLELSKLIGFMPYNNYSEERPLFDLYNGRFVSSDAEKYISDKDVSTAIYKIENTEIDKLTTLSFTKDVRNRVMDDLIIYYRLHIEQFKELKTLEVLRTIF